MKIISLIVRRPDLDRPAFAQHYDQRHAPLALRLLPVPFAAYRRNHVVRPDDAPFDCLSEFCFRDADAAEQTFAFLASDAGQPLHDDEDRFMDRPRNAFYEVEEDYRGSGFVLWPTALLHSLEICTWRTSACWRKAEYRL